MSSFALEETLEADWVATNPHTFQEWEKHKFVFIVAWNEIEGKFVITCHNRTVQRQRSSSLLPKILLHAKSSSARRPLQGLEAAHGAEEIKVLKLGKEETILLSLPPSLLQAAESVTPDGEPMEEECSWASLFFQDLWVVHQQLCSVNSELEPYLPTFPEEPSGVWMVLFGAPELSEQEMDALCYKLQVYLLHSLDTYGWKILLPVLFTETDDPEEYYENLSELRQKGYEEMLQRTCRRIREMLSSTFAELVEPWEKKK
ncbi:hypothetical protein BTVI_09462 [Pitangus sulphuratus]|nr:hypothetical protein BTVI_09462 [Pitangus sulphuratus]